MDEDILNDVVSTEYLKKFEREYLEQRNSGTISRETQFNYCWCLVRSKYSADIHKGIVLLEELFNSESINNEQAKRDYLYYLAVGNARIKEYVAALKYIRGFLEIEPSNQQVLSLQTLVKKKMESEAIKGMAVFGGAALAAGGLLGLAYALTKKK